MIATSHLCDQVFAPDVCTHGFSVVSALLQTSFCKKTFTWGWGRACRRARDTRSVKCVTRTAPQWLSTSIAPL